MVQITQSHQYPLQKFTDVQQAADALHRLEEQGFDSERLAIVPESLQSRPPIEKTEAANNAGTGAVAGTVFGAMVGFLLASFSLSDVVAPDMAPLAQILSISLIGSGVGAAGGAAIAAITGGSVTKKAVESATTSEAENYLLVVDNTTPEEVQKAQTILQQQS